MFSFRRGSRMIRATLAAGFLALAAAAPAAAEQPVDPYVQSDANAGATPIAGDAAFRAFHGQAGVDRVVDGLVDRSIADPRISEIFKNQDIDRLRRTLKEQLCYLLGGGCAYTGRDMKTSHAGMGIQQTDFNALVENLQAAMDREGVPFADQNRLLAKLAPMERTTVTRPTVSCRLSRSSLEMTGCTWSSAGSALCRRISRSAASSG